MDLKLTDKLALVSGSTAGIGLAIATSLAAEGARVIVNGRTKARVSEALDKIRKEFGAALADTAVRGKLSELGNEVMIMSPAQFRKTIVQQIEETRQIFKAAGIEPQ